MTMRIKVTNEDQTRTARVRVRDAKVYDGKTTGEFVEDSNPPTEIAPGQSADFYVHSTRDLIVEEV
jgi:hypothetical protein